eukprot:520359_1
MQCQHKLSPCNASLGIKRALKQFNAILSDKTVTSSAALEKKANELIHNANVQLMNDFYHVKYDHNTNNDPQQFTIFCGYLNDGDNVLQCDISYCQRVRRYFNRRYQTSQPFADTDNKEETESSCVSTFHILCRIHAYFIHSYDVSQLPRHERRYIGNCFKFVETTFACIDGDKMASILRNKCIDVDVNELQLIFDKKQYDMKQLMTDLCDIFTNKTSADTLLPSIIIEVLHLKDNDKPKQQEIYESILNGGFITKADLNHHNFLKILKISAFKVNQDLNLQEIEQIASNKHLTGNIYAKDNKWTSASPMTTITTVTTMKSKP